MATLSVVVSVHNGEEFLAKCLDSVKELADEIIVVDHESTDATLLIAKKYTKKIYQQKNNPQDIDRQKNFGFEKATKDWILSLDADECITDELAHEIRSVLSEKNTTVAYWIPRKNIIFGKWIEHTGWYPDYQLRLFQTGKGKYVSEHVHEDLAINGDMQKLSLPLVHEAYQAISQFIFRGLIVYAPNEAKALRSKGYVFSYKDAIKFPFQEFLSRFFAREGYRDGFHGFALSFLMAMYHFCVFLYLWENEKFADKVDVLSLLANETKNIQKEVAYWMKETEIKNAENPTKKILLKTKRKLGL